MKSLTGYCLLSMTFMTSSTHQVETQNATVPYQDCTQMKALSPQASSGVYLMQPPGVNTSFQAYCEMRDDGGWTVFQRRSGPDVRFDRKWAAYKKGFGNLTEDHWLGLDKVFLLTTNTSTKWMLRVDLWDHEGGTAFALYKNFSLGSEKKAYKLNVGKYRGNAGDAIRGAYEGIDQNGFGFSTIDKDNDGCSPCVFGDIAENACSFQEGGSAWWYSRCGSASLHGDWHPAGDNIGWLSGLHWDTWKTRAPYSLKATRMMIKSV